MKNEKGKRKRTCIMAFLARILWGSLKWGSFLRPPPLRPPPLPEEGLPLPPQFLLRLFFTDANEEST
jgi:hypothetical protein